MFNKSDIKRVLDVNVAMSSEMINAIELWSNMYKNESPWLSSNVKSLNLPASIASEVARLVTIEMKVEVSGSPRAEYINEQLEPVVSKLREQVEYGCAKGGLIMKPYVDNGKITVDFVQADCFFPTAYDSSGRITGVVFIDQINKGSKIYTRLEYHNLTDEGYYIANKAFISENKSDIGREISLSNVDEWASLEPEVLITHISHPLFAYFKVPQANTIDTRSPLGVSVYSRAVELIEEVDKQYSRLLWEFESGERALYTDETVFRKDKDGNPVLPNKRLYKTLNLGGTDGEKLFEDWTPTLREQNILNGLNSILIQIEDKCGLARGTFSDPQTEAKTATELKILRQRSYATISDTQKSLQNALSDLIVAIDTWCTLYKLAPKGKYEASFEWDDSIVADRQTEFAEKQQLVALGVLHPWEFRAWYLGESEETAKDTLAEKGQLFGAEE